MSLQFAAQITPESAQHVHHMLLYLCDGQNLTGDPAVGVSQECDGISERIQPCRYSTIVAGWAIGGNVMIIIYCCSYHTYVCTYVCTYMYA